MTLRAGCIVGEAEDGTMSERSGGELRIQSDIQLLAVTPEARLRALDARDELPNAEDLAFEITVTGSIGDRYTHDLAFVETASAGAGDHVEEHDGLTLVVRAASIERLAGATLQLPDPDQGGFVVRNPNFADPLDLGDLELTGDVAERVQQLLDAKINPALAGHGGFAELDGVEGSTVRIRMGGGCHGCALSMVTMQENITKLIIDAIDDATAVVDVTDHSSGFNPFYR
jgi:Fe/S biogenesis protein NfuA